jgi:hypothetical protein
MDSVARFIIISTSREYNLVGVVIVNGTTRFIQTMHDPGIQFQILLFWVRAGHISCMYYPSLPFDTLYKFNINNQESTSCVRPSHVMVFLIAVSVLVCPG